MTPESSVGRRDLVTRVLDGVASLGRTGVATAARLDGVRATGAPYAWRRFRHDSSLVAALRAHRTRLYRRIWAEAAQALDATITDLPGEFVQIRANGRVTLVRQHSTTLDGEVAVELGTVKAAGYRLLSAHGLPVPEHVELNSSDPAPAVEFIRTAPPPFIVKPAVGGAGFGVTGNVETVSDLRRAMLRASLFTPRVIVERQHPGSVYRLLLLDGELIDTICRSPPHVTGDGQSSIGELAFAECCRRVEKQGMGGLLPLWVDLDAVLTLRREGLRSSSVLPQNVRIPLKVATNQNAAHENVTINSVSPDLVAEAARAAAAVGLRLAGVDVVTSDATTSLVASGGVVLEVNRPALHHHYLVADPDHATRVAVPVLARALGLSS